MALRKLTAISNAETGRAAVIYWDKDWQEYRVKFSCNFGQPMCESSDYHTDDHGDAHGTASHWVNNRAEALGNLA